jgi:hypothetical protein
MIEKRKHGKRNNAHDSRKSENKQNNFHGNLHSRGMVAITIGMSQSLSEGQEGVYLCLLSLQEKLEDANQ